MLYYIVMAALFGVASLGIMAASFWLQEPGLTLLAIPSLLATGHAAQRAREEL